MSNKSTEAEGVAMPSEKASRPHWFFDALKRNQHIYWRVAVAAVVTNIFALSTSIFTMTVYDRILPNNATESLIAMAVSVGTVIIFDFIILS